MWDVLKEYPMARIRLEAIASKRLLKYEGDKTGKYESFHKISIFMGILKVRGR